jgi:hypothetical protein
MVGCIILPGLAIVDLGVLFIEPAVLILFLSFSWSY